MQRAFKKVCNNYIELRPGEPNFNQAVVNMAEQHKPDIIFLQIQTQDVISKEAAVALAKNSFVINWNGDIRKDLHPWFIEIGKEIQLTTFSNMRDVYTCRAAGLNSDFLQIGYDPDRYKVHHTNKSGPEIVAHFNNYGPDFFPLSQYRLDIVRTLRDHFGNNFGVYGNFIGAQGNFNTSQPAESANYNRAKIAINCSHFNVERYTSDRLLRIMGSGCFALTHDYDGIHHDFKTGDHLDTFWDLDDLVAKCHYYLHNAAEREKIAAAGLQHVLNKHTFDHMANDIVELYLKYKK